MTLRTRIGARRRRRRAFLEMLWPREALKALDTDALATDVAALIGRDLAYQPPILMQQLMAMGRHDGSRRLPELRDIPTLVISAEHDPIALPRFGENIARAIPGARFELMPSASHGLTIQHAQQLNERLIQFLSSVELAPASRQQ